MSEAAKPFYKALDAAMTASLQPKRAVPSLARRLLRPRLSNYERISTAVNLLDGLLPGVSSRLYRSLYSPQYLPLPLRKISLMSFGSGSTVFLLDLGPGCEPNVLKIYRRSLGKRGADLYEIARHFKGKYEQVAAWYAGPHSLVPRSVFVTLQGPLLGKPAVGVIQPFLTGQKYDFFRSFSEQELFALMEQHPDFRTQFLFFAEKTLEVFQRSRQCFDLIGKDNLMVIREGSTARLAVIDFGIFDVDALERRSPAVFRQVNSAIQRIETLYQQART